MERESYLADVRVLLELLVVQVLNVNSSPSGFTGKLAIRDGVLTRMTLASLPY